MKYSNYTIFIIGIVFLMHFLLINPLEKSIVFGLTDNNIIKRPEDGCSDNSSFKCIGMPSGHSETVVIVCLLLFKFKLLALMYLPIIIGLVGLERIFSNRHTVLQVFSGWSIGLLYSVIYLHILKKYSITIVLLATIVISIILSLLLTTIINQKVSHTPVPEWVKPELFSIIEKKQNVPYINKFIYSLTPIFLHNFAPFYSWARLEHVLDKLLDKCLATSQSYDIIIGIKSGGAIIASYIHTKMENKPLYFLKVKRNKEDTHTDIFKDLYEKGVENKKYNMTVVEGIKDDISNKHILLLDETVETGQSMLFAKEYLKNEKHVASVTLATININNTYVKSSINENDIIYYSKTENVTIFPWGYDN